MEEVRQAYGVSAANCMIDSGFKASEIYRFCAATGWKAFKGDDAEYFTVATCVMADSNRASVSNGSFR